MNIKKTNPIGVEILEKKGFAFKKSKDFLDESRSKGLPINGSHSSDFTKENKAYMDLNMRVFSYIGKDTKILKLTKGVAENCRLINLDSIKENVRSVNFNFTDIVILLENDNQGIVKINRLGEDFEYLHISGLNTAYKLTFDRYSFLTKEFLFPENEDSKFVIQLLTYLFYGDITEKHVKPKSKVALGSFQSFVNNSKLDITIINSLWKQRISTDGFKVRGHFRLQPFGIERKKRKLIWIEEFEKDGYNRKATIELS
jgi:hypothetical protein